MTAVLAGIRVLDFGRFLAAPYCAMILADLGADVIRVERPGGEEDRSYGLPGPNGENAFFLSCARNKKAITLNLRGGARGREVLRDLLLHTDIFIHNFSPGAAEAMGLAYDAISAIKPNIIYTAISCYGSEGPYSQRLGFDPIAQTISGSASLNGFPGDPPFRSQLPWVDYSTALSAAIGTLAALRHRDATGMGQKVECALMQTAVSFMAPIIAEETVFGRERPRIGNRAAYVGPSDLYLCLDGWVYLSTIMDTMWKRLLKAIDQEALADDPELTSDLARFESRERVDPLIADWMAARPVEEVLKIMDEARIPCGRFNRPAEVATDAHVRAAGMLPTIDAGVEGMEALPVGKTPFNLSSTPATIQGRPPRIGEHNGEIYGGLLCYDGQKLRDLEAEGVI